jgi:hypothetical protein
VASQERSRQHHQLACVPEQREGCRTPGQGRPIEGLLQRLKRHLPLVGAVREVAVRAVKIAERRRLDNQKFQGANLAGGNHRLPVAETAVAETAAVQETAIAETAVAEAAAVQETAIAETAVAEATIAETAAFRRSGRRSRRREAAVQEQAGPRSFL